MRKIRNFGFISKKKVAREIAKIYNGHENTPCPKEQFLRDCEVQSALNLLCAEFGIKPMHLNKLGGGSSKMESTNKISPVGGVDCSGKIDRISLQNAVETPFWLAVWATEPDRPICVEMSYSDLKIITDLIDALRKQAKV